MAGIWRATATKGWQCARSRGAAQRLRLVLVLTATCVGAAIAPRPATAAEAQPAARGLQPLDGRGGCVSPHEPSRCLVPRGASARWLAAWAVSPDERSLYAIPEYRDAIVALRRDARSGRVHQPRGPRGCVAPRGRGGCGRLRGYARGRFNYTSDLVVSPDGRHVYALSDGGSPYGVRLLGFARDARSGRLRQLPGKSGCVSSRPTNGCALARSIDLHDFFELFLAPDGRTVVVPAADALTVLRRDTVSGALKPQACFDTTGTRGCQVIPVWGTDTNAVNVLFAPDGRFVYVTATGSQSHDLGDGAQGFLLTFIRDAETGMLTLSNGETACLAGADVDVEDLEPINGCALVPALLTELVPPVLGSDDRMWLATSDIYADSGTIVELRRDPMSGALAAVPTACWAARPTAGCAVIAGLSHPVVGPIVAPDGRSVHLATSYSPYDFGSPITDSAVVSLRRDFVSAQLSPFAPPRGCVTGTQDAGCARLPGLRDPYALALTRDGLRAYLLGRQPPKLITLRRRADGSLARVRGRTVCYRAQATPSCRRARGIQRPIDSLFVSRDDRFLYVLSGGLAIFRRSPRRPTETAATAQPLRRSASSTSRRNRRSQVARSLRTTPRGVR